MMMDNTKSLSLSFTLLLLYSTVVVARHLSFSNSQILLQANTQDYFKCSSVDKTTVVCPDNSPICSCPPGFYGDLKMDEKTKKWEGVCTACKVGYWSNTGAKIENECKIVECPAHSINHPNCICEDGAEGEVNWLYCTGVYVGQCHIIPQVPTSPPFTTIFSGPTSGSFVEHSSISFFFKANIEKATFVCTLDSKEVPCSPPSLNFERLSQGNHTLTIQAINEQGQREENPPTIRFLVKVPCPEHSYSLGVSADYKCRCYSGFYSSTGKDHEYIYGGYEGTCDACQTCEAGGYRVGCDEYSSGKCELCPTGGYKLLGLYNSAWSTKCTECEPCNAGNVRVGCGFDSPGSCSPCGYSEYKDTTGMWNSTCLSCESCPVGSQRTGCGGSASGECTDCPSTTYKEIEGPWNLTCSACIGCDAGYERQNCSATSSGVCVKCPVNYYKSQGKNSHYTTKCMPCESCAKGFGYRVCGGPLGPGTCGTTCEECVGSPEDQCFCGSF